MSIWWSLHLRREAASVPLARRLLLGTMETAGVDPDVSYDLSVALTEACANAVEHGGDAARGTASEAYR
ncbi:ATP-binding protein, partial [Streptomyces sp. NPDC127044]